MQRKPKSLSSLWVDFRIVLASVDHRALTLTLCETPKHEAL